MEYWGRGSGKGLVADCNLVSPTQETQQIPTEEVQLEVFLSNGQKVKVTILTSDQTEDVLEVRTQIGHFIWIRGGGSFSLIKRHKKSYTRLSLWRPETS